MTEIGFYHLQRQTLEQALPRLLERVLESGAKAVVRASSDERVEALNMALWTYSRTGFLPHGSESDGFASEQPIFLTTGEDVPNGAEILVLVDGADTDSVDRFTRCLDLFDGNDPDAVAAARQRWQRRRNEGHRLVYWQQGERGWTREREVDPEGQGEASGRPAAPL